MNRTSSHIVYVAVLHAVSLAGHVTGAPQSPPQSPSPTATRPAPARIDVDRILRDLAHPQIKTRTAATAALNNASEDALPLLVEAYGRERDHESKLRVRSAIEHVFYRRQLEGRMGFLGVQPRPEPAYDPVLGKTVEAIFMSRVLPGFPAEMAGVKTGDMMLDFEGRPVGEIMGAARPQQVVRQVNGGVMRMVMPSVLQIEAFTNEVSRREPGSQVRLRLLRCRPTDRELKLTMGDDPGRTLDGASLLLVGVPQLQVPFNDMIGPSIRHGLCVTGVAANSPAAGVGLMPGDVIVGVGRMPFGANVTPDQLQELFKQFQPDSSVVLTVSHVEQVNLTITLGGRPVDRMNPGDMDIAQARFAEWWRQQTGESSLRSPSNTSPSNIAPKSSKALPTPTMLP